jgi:hypothetical protein
MGVAQDSHMARARAFLAAYRGTCNITESAVAAGINPRQHYRWLAKYPKYAEAFRRAQVVAADHLESIAVERAANGWEEPVFYQGAECGAVRRFDSGLLQFLLRGARPEKYKNSAELTGKDGAPLATTLKFIIVDNDTPKP